MPTPTQIHNNKYMTKQERAINCFDRLKTKSNLGELCNKASAAKIATTADLSNIGFASMDGFNLNSYNEYCEYEFKENGIVPCNTLPKPAPIPVHVATDQQPAYVPVSSEAIAVQAEPAKAETASTTVQADALAEDAKEAAATEEKVVAQVEAAKVEAAATEEKVVAQVETAKVEAASTEEKVVAQVENAEPAKVEAASTEEKVAAPAENAEPVASVQNDTLETTELHSQNHSLGSEHADL